MLEIRTSESRRLAEDLLGPVDELIHQPYGHAGITFEVQTSAGDFILKTRDEPGAFDHTEYHIQVLRELGILVPSIVHRGIEEGFAYLLLRKIPGRDLGHVLGEMTPDQMSVLAGQVVDIERKVGHLPPGIGFGWTPMRVPGPFASWTEVIARDSRGCPNDVLAEIERRKPYFDRLEPVCFLDDLTVKNVIVLDGQFQGIVDLDEVCYGDPLYWLSLAETTVVLDVGLSASFYGQELRRLWGMTREAHAICDLYCVIHGWSFLNRGSGGDTLAQWTAERFRSAVQGSR